MEYKWHTSENEDASRICKQHAYISSYRRDFLGCSYLGNKTLCSRAGLSEDGEKYISFSKIESEEQDENCCKKCLKAVEKLKQNNK